MILGSRCKFSRHHRWAVVLIFPDEGLGVVKTALIRCRRRREAVRRCPDVSRRPEVIWAIVEEGAALEIRRVDRLGFVI